MNDRIELAARHTEIPATKAEPVQFRITNGYYYLVYTEPALFGTIGAGGALMRPSSGSRVVA